VVVLGSDPCDLQIGREGVEGETTFRTPRGVAARRTGGREHATTRASRLKKRVKKTMPPYGVYGVGSEVAI